MDHDLNALLIFEDEEEPGSIYEYVLVDKDRLPEVLETAKLAYNEWVNDWRGGNVFEFIFKALEKASIPHKCIKDHKRIKGCERLKF